MNNAIKIGIRSMLLGLLVQSCTAGKQLVYHDEDFRFSKIHKILCFPPEIHPDIEEVKPRTYESFFGTFTNTTAPYKGSVIISLMDTPLKYDSIDPNVLKENCANNGAQLAIVPRITYFKVGIGRYVFSNQVLVELRLVDQDGKSIIETRYDTYRGNARLIGSAENAIRIGTQGALKKMNQEIWKKNIAHKNTHQHLSTHLKPTYER